MLGSIARFPGERCDQLGHHRIVACNNVKAGCTETQTNNLNRITPKRAHLISEKLHLRSATRLAVTNDERSALQPQCGNLGKRDMLVSQPFALDPAVRVKEDEVGTARRADEFVDPQPAQ